MVIWMVPTAEQYKQQQEQMQAQWFPIWWGQPQNTPTAPKPVVDTDMTMAERWQQAAASVDPMDIQRADEFNTFMWNVYLYWNDSEFISQAHPELYSALWEEWLLELKNFYWEKINQNGTLDIPYQEIAWEFPQFDLYFNNTKPATQVGNKVVQQVRNVIWWSSEGMKRVVNSIPTILAYGIWEVAKAVWANKEEVNDIRDEYLKFIQWTSSAESIWADEESGAFKATREAVNIAWTSLMGSTVLRGAQAATKAWKAALTANPNMSWIISVLDDLATKWWKAGKFARRILKNTAEWTLDLSLYFPWAEWRMPNKQDLTTNAILSAAFPVLWVAGRSVKKLAWGTVQKIVARTSWLWEEWVNSMLEKKWTKEFLETFQWDIPDVEIAKDFLWTIRWLQQRASTLFQRWFNEVDAKFMQMAPDVRQQLIQRWAQIKNQFAINLGNLLQNSRINIAPIMSAMNAWTEITKEMIDAAFVNRAKMPQETRDRIITNIQRIAQYNDFSPSWMDFLRKELYWMFQWVDNDIYQWVRNLLWYEKGTVSNLDDLWITDLGINTPTFREMMEDLPFLGEEISSLNKKYSDQTSFVNELETLFVPGWATPDKVKDSKYLDTILTRFNTVFKENKPAQRQVLDSLKKMTWRDFLAKIAGMKASEAAPSGMITNIIGAAWLIPFSFLATWAKSAALTSIAPIAAMYLAFTPKAITKIAQWLNLGSSAVNKMKWGLWRLNALLNLKAKEAWMSPVRFRTLMYWELLDQINDTIYGDQSNY